MAFACRSWPLPILPQERSTWEQSAATRAVYVPGRLLRNKGGQAAGHRHGELHWMQFILNLAFVSGFGSVLPPVRAVGGAPDLETGCQRFPVVGAGFDLCRVITLCTHLTTGDCFPGNVFILSNIATCCRSSWGLHHFPHASGDVTYIHNQISVSCLHCANCPCLEQPPTPWRCHSDTAR